MRVVIADDSVLIRAGVVRVLEISGHEVVAETGDGASLLAAVATHRPDAVVVDVRMPPTFKDEGIVAAVQIRERFPATAVLVLSQFVEERYATDLLARDTTRVGYLLKDRVADIDSFIESLERVAAGGTALDPEVVAQLLVRRPADPLDRLTPRERDVLALMAEGRANGAIADVLAVSESAVGKHINNIFMKLDLQPDDLGHRRVLAVLRYLAA
ncbi:two component transcriptional regulator, LuxR family [Catenulispora acidiphila DSM 44928]|jgi:DNA-binding NarL/FixJ family response regulator|uniref:Two component transcriptional regulator, LuxR family n=1 Tax=Catenulispora acidiphila (strain DSM 44928 / JCM 14897 / NBRC 102108 / NRRL B-24433 / ID139908) TaxID=479433 RepID=C7Q791_CATAD|nr:response regulator transcription factor [Catenulispora acidiphila]ACU70179.1 two component transcriptional regulator, LuxR family [Catenulispora acidiphila DSM 44928]